MSASVDHALVAAPSQRPRFASRRFHDAGRVNITVILALAALTLQGCSDTGVVAKTLLPTDSIKLQAGLASVVLSDDGLVAVDSSGTVRRFDFSGGRIGAVELMSGVDVGWQLAAVTAADIFALEPARSRLHNLLDGTSMAFQLASGGFVSTGVLHAAKGDPARLRAFSSTIVGVDHKAGLANAMDMLYGRLKALDVGTRSERVVADFDVLAGYDGPSTAIRRTANPPIPLWDVCPDGEIVVFEPGSELLHYPETGKEPQPLAVPHRARIGWRPAGADRVVSVSPWGLLKAALADMRARGVGRPAPAAVNLHCEASGHLLMQAFAEMTEFESGLWWHVSDINYWSLLNFGDGVKVLRARYGHAWGVRPETRMLLIYQLEAS